MHRNPEHCLSFVLAELGTTGSIDGSQRLMLRGRYVPKYMESLLRKYISTFKGEGEGCVCVRTCLPHHTTCTQTSM